MSKREEILSSVSPEKLETSLSVISKKLNIDQEELRKNIEAGVYDKKFEELDEDQTKQLISVLKNTFLLKAALFSPKVIEMLKGLLNNN
jgi:hypothetical protein